MNLPKQRHVQKHQHEKYVHQPKEERLVHVSVKRGLTFANAID